MGGFLVICLVLLGLLVYFTWNREGTRRVPEHRVEGDPKGSIRIIAPAGSVGTDTDAQIYHQLLPDSYIIYVDETNLGSHPEAGKTVSINLYVEHCLGTSGGDHQVFPAKENWLMVNHEMLSWSPFLHQVDVFLCKTQHSFDLLQDLKNSHSLKGKIVYTKHTSKDLKTDLPKDWNLFVHFAGKSWLKQTDSVLRAWIDNKGFPEYNYPRLVVSCRGRCLTDGVSRLLNDFDKTGRHKKYPNIQVRSFIPDKEYSHLQRTAGVYLCPSLTEGYGHYLNEGRSAGALVVTVDGPPMNELVTPENGILIPPIEQYPTGHEMGTPDLRLDGSIASLVNSEGIAQAVREYYLLSDTEKRQKGNQSRKMFVNDRKYLKGVVHHAKW